MYFTKAMIVVSLENVNIDKMGQSDFKNQSFEIFLIFFLEQTWDRLGIDLGSFFNYVETFSSD